MSVLHVPSPRCAMWSIRFRRSARGSVRKDVSRLYCCSFHFHLHTLILPSCWNYLFSIYSLASVLSLPGISPRCFFITKFLFDVYSNYLYIYCWSPVAPLRPSDNLAPSLNYRNSSLGIIFHCWKFHLTRENPESSKNRWKVTRAFSASHFGFRPNAVVVREDCNDEKCKFERPVRSLFRWDYEPS